MVNPMGVELKIHKLERREDYLQFVKEHSSIGLSNDENWNTMIGKFYFIWAEVKDKRDQSITVDVNDIQIRMEGNNFRIIEQDVN